VSPDLTRRRLLGAAGAAGLALVAGCGGDDESSGTSASSAEPTPTATARATGRSGPAALLDEANSCAVAPETTEGPFYFDPGSVRSDIREDRDGVALRLALRVQQGERCTPVKDAVVSIWHCDALGAYSGFGETEGERFLRGEQVTDADGVVEFVTVYPGWYPGRAVHAHLKVFPGGSTEVTTQLFFDEAFSDSVFEREPYSSAGERDVRIDGDGVYSQADDEGTPLLLTLKRDGDEVLAAGNIVIAS
jgi:protocatechuate 3,4-dioxygenase beta subunit